MLQPPTDELSNVAKEQEPLDNPWFKKMYQAAVNFHERDDVLDSNDRYNLFKIYRSIARAELWGGWLGFSAIFATPFALQFYRTNSIKGVKVRRYFVLGFINMIGTTRLAGLYTYNKNVRVLDPDGLYSRKNNYGDEDVTVQQSIKPSKQRQYDMLTLLKDGSPTMWSAYFYMTYNNPEKRFPDPKVKLEEMKQPGFRRGSILNQRDPMGLYSDPKFDKKTSILENNTKSEKQTMPGPFNKDTSFDDNNETQSPDSWNKIREVNGTTSSSWDRVRSGINKSGDNSISDSDDIFEQNEPTQEDYNLMIREERNNKH